MIEYEGAEYEGTKGGAFVSRFRNEEGQDVVTSVIQRSPGAWGWSVSWYEGAVTVFSVVDYQKYRTPLLAIHAATVALRRFRGA